MSGMRVSAVVTVAVIVLAQSVYAGDRGLQVSLRIPLPCLLAVLLGGKRTRHSAVSR